MKKLIAILAVMAGLRGMAQAYSLDQFMSQAKFDTKAVLGKEFRIAYRFDTLSTSQKFDAYSSILAWKCIAVGPAILSPSDINQKAEIAVNFPLRLKRIPVNLNTGEEIGDYMERRLKIHGWFDHVSVSLNLTANLSTGMFEFPVVVQYMF